MSSRSNIARALARSSQKPLHRPLSSTSAQLKPSSSESSSSSFTSTSTSDESEAEARRKYPLIYHHPIQRPSNFPPPRFPDAPRHKLINKPYRVFPPAKPEDLPDPITSPNAAETRQKREAVLAALTGMSTAEVGSLARITTIIKKPAHMSSKGRIRAFSAYVVAGSPQKGLVGLGMGKAQTVVSAVDKAFHKAVMSMDYVNKYEGRTLWGQGKELERKFGATIVKMRARPAGHGLAVPDTIHRILTACGVRDCSAAIYGSTEKTNVMKCVLSILHGGVSFPSVLLSFFPSCLVPFFLPILISPIVDDQILIPRRENHGVSEMVRMVGKEVRRIKVEVCAV
ncbi:hypothetical protein BCR39DRAFT_533980 [Naematelia encephala]|uniref:S5 DRBM domain-containing protein n=1 Tax=Naematelia encephala TaxID=71784 RepID=A0A1Y2B1U3_9TREE|nr:hypothetical protein BCR39DRAFT_533980 [Naematelia encephala]